jgi:hypothetical protein
MALAAYQSRANANMSKYAAAVALYFCRRAFAPAIAEISC